MLRAQQEDDEWKRSASDAADRRDCYWARCCRQGTGRRGGPQTRFSGNWELDIGESDLGKMPRPTRMTLKATRSGEALHAIQTTYDQSGGPDAVEGIGSWTDASIRSVPMARW